MAPPPAGVGRGCPDRSRRRRPRARAPAAPVARGRLPRPTRGERSNPSRALPARAVLLHELGDEARPARLVAGPEPGAGVAVEVLVEEDEVPPVRIGLKLVDTTEDRPPPILITDEDAGEPAGQLQADLPERHESVTARGAGHLEAVAVEVIELLERLDQEVVDGKPHRPAPVGVAAEEPARRLGRLVVDAILHAVDVEQVGVLTVHAYEDSVVVER